METFRLSNFFQPTRLFYWRHILWRSQYWSSGKLRQLQWNLLSGLLDHCFLHVPFYKYRLEELGLRRSDFRGLEDLAKLPVINKYIVKERFDDFKAIPFNRYNPKRIRSTGTSGYPLDVYWDSPSNVIELLCQYRHFSWAGYRLGEPFLDIRSVVFDESEVYRWNWQCRGLEVSSDYIDSSNIEYYAGLLRKYRIKLWRGYPQSIDYFCRLLEDAGINDIKPKTIVSVAFSILPYQCQFIESWSGVPVCDNYGLDEHVALICQCPESKGYHIAPEYGIVEIIASDGTAARDGEEGRLIATGLHNRAFPLIRYDTMDFAIASERRCTCGRTLPIIEKLTGRIDDFILDTRGRWVSAVGFPLINVKGIRKAQIVQETEKSLDVFIVPEKSFGKLNENQIIREYRKKLGRTMEIRVHHVDEVPYPRPGKKYKFSINKIKRKFER
ncbi:hypothetical protein BVY01_01695 [bacterium I07]|nr:hypothetical protein BVY01_01695 [bacterium I07]